MLDKVTSGSKDKPKFDSNIGQGGLSIKNHLKSNLDQGLEEVNHNKIQIDINPQSFENETMHKRKAGRPRKIKRTVDDLGRDISQNIDSY